MTEYIITIKDRLRARRRRLKSMVLPSKHGDVLSRRKTNPLITFYDLGQVNNEDLNDAPVWSDHPILKTPAYAIEAKKFGGHPSGTNMSEVEYQLDPFTDADFQDFTDMMFTYPVQDWNRRYRQINTPDEDPDNNFTFDMRFSLRDDSAPSGNDFYLANHRIDRDILGVDYNTTKDSYLTDFHRAYEDDRQGAIYRSLAELTVNLNPALVPDQGTGGYFGLSTENKDVYKVTATYDSSAADVGSLTPSGSIEIYLMPQIGMWAATSNSADYQTTEVLGLCYQVQPRHLWPRYVDPITNESGAYGADADVAAYLSYQQGRSGVQYSVWQFFGYDSDPFDPNPIVTETPGVPSDWTGQAQWGLASSAGTVLGSSWFTSFARSGPGPSSGVTNFSTTFKSNTSDPNFGLQLFNCASPFLVAVIKMHGTFYYVWDISDSVDPFGNYSCAQTLDQEERFRMYRGITWNAAYMPLTHPLDGTGAFFGL